MFYEELRRWCQRITICAARIASMLLWTWNRIPERHHVSLFDWYSTLVSLTDCHWDSVVICREVLRPADHQKSAHPYVSRKWLLFWSDGVLVLVPLGDYMMVSFLFPAMFNLYPPLITPSYIHVSNEWLLQNWTSVGSILSHVSRTVPSTHLDTANAHLSSLSLSNLTIPRFRVSGNFLSSAACPGLDLAFLLCVDPVYKFSN
jgi:hypothetical protein